jgi:hypothetical protein
MNTVGENIGKGIEKVYLEAYIVGVDTDEEDILTFVGGLEVYVKKSTPCYPCPDPSAIQPGEEVEYADGDDFRDCQLSPGRFTGMSADGRFVIENWEGKFIPWNHIRRIPFKKSVREQAIEAMQNRGWNEATSIAITDVFDVADLLRKEE